MRTLGSLLLACASLWIGENGTAAPLGNDTDRDHEYVSHALRGSGMGRSAPHPYQYDITATSGLLIGGEGRSGDAVQSDGGMVWGGPGYVSIVANERDNRGLVIGIVRTQDHTYTVMMNRFSEQAPYMDGGVARNLYLYGTTGQGLPIMPQTWTYLAGWGDGCTVYKDDTVLYEQFECEFMVTDAVRDPIAHNLYQFPDKAALVKLVQAKRTRRESDGAKEQTDADIKDIERQVKEAAFHVDKNRLEVHLIAHSSQKNFDHLPPYDTTVHFMWEEVKWWGPRIGDRTIREQRQRYEGADNAGDRPAAASHEDDMGLSAMDQALKKSVRRHLYYDPLVHERDIRVTVRDRVATLFGLTRDSTEYHAAVDAACRAGVSRVLVRVEIEVPYDPHTVGFGTPAFAPGVPAGPYGHLTGRPAVPMNIAERSYDCVKRKIQEYTKP